MSDTEKKIHLEVTHEHIIFLGDLVDFAALAELTGHGRNMGIAEQILKTTLTMRIKAMATLLGKQGLMDLGTVIQQAHDAHHDGEKVEEFLEELKGK